jgi:hypothetical protein
LSHRYEGRDPFGKFDFPMSDGEHLIAMGTTGSTTRSSMVPGRRSTSRRTGSWLQPSR